MAGSACPSRVRLIDNRRTPKAFSLSRPRLAQLPRRDAPLSSLTSLYMSSMNQQMSEDTPET